MKTDLRLPVLERAISVADMVAYAGATWDWHRLHYDAAFLEQAGLDKPVVDGQMLGALMAEQILDHFGPRAFLTALAFRFSSMVFAGDTVRVEGRITSSSAASAQIAQRVLAGDRLCGEGTATVRL